MKWNGEKWTMSAEQDKPKLDVTTAADMDLDITELHLACFGEKWTARATVPCGRCRSRQSVAE